MITLNLGADFDFWHWTFERAKGKGKSKRGKVGYAQRLTHGMAYLWDWVADQAHKHGAWPPPRPRTLSRLEAARRIFVGGPAQRLTAAPGAPLRWAL